MTAPTPMPHPLPRVLFVSDLDPGQKRGTFEDQVLALARSFARRGGVFLPLYRAPLDDRARADYARHGLRAESLDLRAFNLHTLRALAGLVRRERIGLVHWNFYDPIKNGYVWGLSVLAPRLTHGFTDHNSGPPVAPGPEAWPRRLVKRALYARYRRVFCVSDYVAERLQAGSRWPNVARWEHLVDTDRFAPDPAARAEVRRDLGAGDGFVSLVVAHLTAEKGVDVALRALARLPAPHALWVVGGGPDRDELAALADRLGVADRVRFFGLQWDVSRFLRGADCLVCPSLWAEAAGLVNLEGLASGLPVVASRVGGIPELVEDGRTGFLFPPGDDGRLAAILGALGADPDALAERRRDARASALARFSLAGRIDDYVGYYEAMGRAAGPAVERAESSRRGWTTCP